jgi:molybdopterin-containing oxidoreductase family iron-sulfur binding subunit
MNSEPLDLSSVRRRMDGARGRTYWKSLEELAETPAFLEFLHREFPEQASEFTDPAGRRQFLTLMGASLALAGLTACTRQPEEKVVPYVKAPEDVVPGKPLFFATAVLDRGFARGVLVESHMGRPTKVEGNPDHPASLGGTDAFGQAAVLGLYDPDRSQILTYRGEIRPWSAFLAAIRAALDEQRPRKGAGLRILTETVTSPTLAAQLQELLTALPEARWHQYEPASRVRAAGGVQEPVYDLSAAAVILSLEADFIGDGPAKLRLIRQFASRRKRPARERLNRLYVVESTPTLTGMLADHRLPLRSSEVERMAGTIAAALGLQGGAAGGPHAEWAAAAARDLREHAGASVVIAGEYQPPAVADLARAMNEALGNVGKTVSYAPAVEARPVDSMASLRELVADMNAGRVELLLVLGGNPVYSAPVDLELAPAMDKVKLRVHLGQYDDETAERCHWHVPEAHGLETWSDARAFDGSATVMQPLIAPLYGGKSAHEVLAALSERPDRSGHDIVKDHWKTALAGAEFDSAWRRMLHDGVVKEPVRAAAPAAAPAAAAVVAPAAPAAAEGQGLELVFRPDPTIQDGRYANLGWLQELPKPITKTAWGNAALVSPTTAQQLGVTTGDVVSLQYRGRSVEAPVWVMPGQADGSVAVHLGYGRRRAGRVGTGLGFDAYRLRTSDAPWFGAGLQVTRTARREEVPCTQDHWTIDREAETRHVVREVTVEEYEREPARIAEMTEVPPRDESMYPNYRYGGHAWGMAIDLNSCVGCGACTIACQAENNIPVVGKDQVARGREMHWIRVDRYFSGDPFHADTVRAHFQPVPCMQCEDAPCEVVCPVGATVHSDEGLNDQVYNRCVGTRYCSNNCPYKVRRFNFLLYQDFTTPSLKLLRNPDVTVRSRGVMEKCTYCVQRIQQARVAARNEGRAIRDGDIQTACQSACPAEAIVFGDVNDPASRVSQWKAEPRNYALLGELNTRPRTTYLAEVKNPNEELKRGD